MYKIIYLPDPANSVLYCDEEVVGEGTWDCFSWETYDSAYNILMSRKLYITLDNDIKFPSVPFIERKGIPPNESHARILPKYLFEVVEV